MTKSFKAICIKDLPSSGFIGITKDEMYDISLLINGIGEKLYRIYDMNGKYLMIITGYEKFRNMFSPLQEWRELQIKNILDEHS